MVKMLVACVEIVATVIACNAAAQIYDTNNDVVQTYVGSGLVGYYDGVGQQTMFSGPNALVADSQGNLFVWDSGNYKIRKIAPGGNVSTFVASVPQSNGITSLAIDSNNTIWMPSAPYVLYKITSNAVVSKVTIPLWRPGGVCVDSFGNVYLTETESNQVYRLNTNGVLSLFAGSGNAAYMDGNGIFSAFNQPLSLAADSANNIYVWDSGNLVIRKIDQNQNVSTFAGQQQFSYILDGTNGTFANIGNSGMCFDGYGNLILACNTAVRKISPTTNVTTLAGSFSQNGFANGAGNLARFYAADGVCVCGGTVYVADSGNQRIRSITSNPVAQPVSGGNLKLNTYPGLQITGTIGRTYQIQCSPDMTNWTIQATVILSASPYLWIDQNPVSGNKFYRALLLP